MEASKKEKEKILSEGRQKVSSSKGKSFFY